MPPKKRRKLQKRSTATKQRHATAKRKRQDAGGDARSAHLAKQGSKTRKDKIHDIEQSVGSLDRRINKAIEGGNLDQAKDLRSRQNKFTTKLGLERAIESGGVLRDKEGRIVRSSTTGQPVMTTAGRDIFSQTKDMDFIDPTRRIQNVGGDAYGQMYPFANAMQRGLPGLTNLMPGLGMVKNIAKSALSPFKKAATDLRTLAGAVTGSPFEGVGQGLSNLFNREKNKQIPYTDPMMPGERYPLDEIIKEQTITEEEPFYGGRSLLDEDSSLDEIIERYRQPPEIPTDIDLEEQWPPSPFDKVDPKQEVVDEFGLSTTVPKEVIVQDVIKNLTENIAMEEGLTLKDAEALARKELSSSTLTPPAFNLGDFTKQYMTGNAENEAKTILESLPPEIIQSIPPEVITSSSAIDIINSLPPEIVEKTKVEIQEKALPNIYQKPGEKVLTMEDLQAEVGTGPTLQEALPIKKMATTVADMIPYIATGYSGNEWSDIMDKGWDKITGFNTQDGGEWWKEQEQVKEDTSNLLKNQYNLNDDQIEELLNIKTGSQLWE